MVLINGTCLQCGKPYRKRNLKFCSNSCQMTWKNIHDNVSKKPEVRAKTSAVAKATNRQAQLMTPECRLRAIAKISETLTGRTLTDEHKAKIGVGSKRAGCIPPRNPHLIGPKHPCWKGGFRPARTADYYNPKYVAFRFAVLNRDKQTCQDCGAKKCKLQVHHIKEWGPFPDLRYEPSNGITLCLPCHKTRHRGVPRPVTVGPRKLFELRSGRDES